MTATNWIRVNRDHPCPICHRTDWCLIAADGNAAICPRIESPKRCGNAGWLHRLGERTTRPRQFVRIIRLETSLLDFAPLAREFQAAITNDQLHRIVASLGVTEASLRALGIGWSPQHSAYSFPMTDGNDRIIGIRLRKPDGFKFAVKGSKEGIFEPKCDGIQSTPRLLIVEGATDTAAALDLGYDAVIGRPSCTGGVKPICELVRNRKPTAIVVMADADEPGRQGAECLANALVLYAPSVWVVVPPNDRKDLREFLLAGGTCAELEAVIDIVPPRCMQVARGAGK